MSWEIIKTEKPPYYTCNECNGRITIGFYYEASDPYYGFMACLSCLKKIVKKIEEAK